MPGKGAAKTKRDGLEIDRLLNKSAGQYITAQKVRRILEKQECKPALLAGVAL